MKKFLWLLLLPALADAQAPSYFRQDPLYVEVQPDHVVIYPEKTEIAAAGIDAPDGEFEQFLARFEAQRDTRTIVLLLRPGSALFQRQLRQQIRAHGIDVGFEPIDALQALSPDGTPIAPSEPIPVPPPSNPPVPPRSSNPPPAAQMESDPVYADIRADQIILYPGQTEIPADAIAATNGPFAQWLDFVAGRAIQTPVALVIRPDGLAQQAPLTRIFQKRDMSFFKEPWETDRPIDPDVLRSSIAAAAGTLPPLLPTGLDRLQVGTQTVLFATPREMPPDKKPTYWECRHGQLFPISLAEMKTACDAKTEEIRRQTGKDETEFLRQAAQSTVEWNGQSIDYTYALMDRYVLVPIPEAQGMALENQVDSLNPDEDLLSLYVRSDSLELFRQIRALAWARKIEVDVQLLDEKKPIFVGCSNISRD